MKNQFQELSNEELRELYLQYQKFNKTGVIEDGCKLREIANTYIEGTQGYSWRVTLSMNLMEVIADRWIRDMK